MKRTGSREARFRRVFEEHYDAVARYCLRRLSREDADDVAAQVFVVVWRKVDEVPDGDGMLPWLYRIAHYEVSTLRRSVRRLGALRSRVGGLALTHPEDTESVVVRRFEYEAVLAALGSLSGRDREVIFLRSYEELPIAQIATVLGCSREAAAKRQARAFKRLRKAANLPQAKTSVSDSHVVPEVGER